MNRRLILAALALSLQGPLHAAPLPKPAAVTVEPQGPRFTWDPVPGAQLYRVAVFDAPDAEGKRLLLAAVWVKAAAWAYGSGPIVARAAKLPSTKPLPLPSGHKLRVMVAAAGEDGADKSEWVAADFEAAAAKPAAAPELEAPTPSPTATPTPTPAAAQAQALTGSAEATLDVEGGDEFKSSPDPAVIDMQDATKTAGSAAGAVPAAAQAGSGATAAVGGLSAGQALLKAGKDEDAEAVFRAQLTKDPRDADAWEGLGDSFAHRSMKVEAADAYEKALQINGDNKRLKEWMDKNVRY
jgi:tetratricopeptide (TPR) repeat protein